MVSGLNTTVNSSHLIMLRLHLSIFFLSLQKLSGFGDQENYILHVKCRIRDTLAEAILDDSKNFVQLALLCSKKLSESNGPCSGDIDKFFEILSVESPLQKINRRQLY